jgi:hypothetical protein
MDTIRLCDIVALPSDNCKNFRGIAFDGCYFYLTKPQDCSICIFKRDLTLVSCVQTDKPYTCICYDITEDCFWVSEDKKINILYKLDRKLQEIDCFQFRSPATTQILGLSYNCGHNSLTVAYKDFIVEISKEGECICILKEPCQGKYISVASIPPYYVVVLRDEKKTGN